MFVQIILIKLISSAQEILVNVLMVKENLEWNMLTCQASSSDGSGDVMVFLTVLMLHCKGIRIVNDLSGLNGLISLISSKHLLSMMLPLTWQQK